MAKQSSKGSAYEILEQGNIYFIYRPRIQEQDPQSLEDIQRFLMVLAPQGRRLFRLVIIGRKRLPDVREHERNWGFVEAITDSGKAIEESLRREDYETETRGERVRPAARPAGEGAYAILHGDGGMRLAYALELPDEPGAVQRSLNIAPEASFVISIANPERSSPPEAGLREDDQAVYPEELQESFRGRRFADDLKLLDYERTEMVFVGARRHPERRYRVDIEAADETPESAEIFEELRFARSRHPVEPLLTGEWT